MKGLRVRETPVGVTQNGNPVTEVGLKFCDCIKVLRILDGSAEFIRTFPVGLVARCKSFPRI